MKPSQSSRRPSPGEAGPQSSNREGGASDLVPPLPNGASKELRALHRAAVTAAARSSKAADRRAALPPGSSRARVTTANARWSSAAEERDRAIATYAAALVEVAGG